MLRNIKILQCDRKYTILQNFINLAHQEMNEKSITKNMKGLKLNKSMYKISQ